MELKEIDEKIKKGFLRAKTVLEIAGFPEEHIIKTLDLLEKNIGEQTYLEIIKFKSYKPKKVSDKLFSAFIELEFLTNSLSNLLGFIYDYMPSSIEIIEPEDPISDDPQELTGAFNDFIAKLHMYTQTIQGFRAENFILKKELKKLKEK